MSAACGANGRPWNSWFTRSAPSAPLKYSIALTCDTCRGNILKNVLERAPFEVLDHAHLPAHRVVVQPRALGPVARLDVLDDVDPAGLDEWREERLEREQLVVGHVRAVSNHKHKEIKDYLTWCSGT